MRLLALDEREEPFTLRRLKAGDQCGEVGLLRGVTGYALAAAQPSLLWLLPQAAFLRALAESPILQENFRKTSIEEVYGVAVNSPKPKQSTRSELKDWANSVILEEEDDVLLIAPGQHQFDSRWGPWLISSSNISGLSPGDEVLGPINLVVKGKIPGRLLGKKTGTPPVEVPPVMVVSTDTSDLEPQIVDAELLEPNWQESSTAIVTIERQQEALEDWYGRLNNDDSYPHLNARGAVEVPLAVLRMLARYFDLPFRKDVLKRIIEDQLNRTEKDSDEKTLGLIQLAATADLVGLRATQLKIKENQAERLQFPAIVITESGPVVAWSADPTGNMLIGDPVNGQITIRVSELKGRDDDNLIEVLTVQRVKTLQRIGLVFHGFYLRSNNTKWCWCKCWSLVSLCNFLAF